MSQTLVSLGDLNDLQRHANRSAASVMIVNGVYRFDSPVEAIPVEHTISRHRDYLKPISFKEAVYIGFDEEKECHNFLVLCGENKLIVHLFLNTDLGKHSACQFIGMLSD